LLGQPTLRSGGKLLSGGNVDGSTDGTAATFSFPATPFGTPVSLSVDAFSLAGEGGSIVLDLARVLAENGISGATGERGAVSPGAVVRSSVPNLPVTGVAFTETNAKNFEVSLGAPLDPNDHSFPTLVLANGESIRASSKDIGYNRDASGAIIGGQTQLIFRAPAVEALKGNVRLELGQGSQVVNGNWTVSLAPR
jgi:hypothetical protein